MGSKDTAARRESMSEMEQKCVCGHSKSAHSLRSQEYVPAKSGCLVWPRCGCKEFSAPAEQSKPSLEETTEYIAGRLAGLEEAAGLCCGFCAHRHDAILGLDGFHWHPDTIAYEDGAFADDSIMCQAQAIRDAIHPHKESQR